MREQPGIEREPRSRRGFWLMVGPPLVVLALVAVILLMFGRAEGPTNTAAPGPAEVGTNPS
jgi:hypothetical protein